MPAHCARWNRGRKSVELLTSGLHFMTEQIATGKVVASQRPFRFVEPDKGCESYRPGLQSKGSAKAGRDRSTPVALSSASAGEEAASPERDVPADEGSRFTPGARKPPLTAR